MFWRKSNAKGFFFCFVFLECFEKKQIGLIIVLIFTVSKMLLHKKCVIKGHSDGEKNCMFTWHMIKDIRLYVQLLLSMNCFMEVTSL